MDDQKVYYPQTIADTPFPGAQDQLLSVATPGSASTQVYQPQTITDVPLPEIVIAHETLSSSLNTLTKKIIDTFTFVSSGAIQIGKYINGLSGDIRISPNGITARDIAGNTTFALDGDTGKATFSGEVQAADFTVIDEHGLVSLSTFVSDQITHGANFDTVSPTYVDITGTTLQTSNLPRACKAIVFASVAIFGTNDAPGDFSGESFVGINVNGSVGAEIRMRSSYILGETNADITTISNFEFASLKAGINTFKLQMRADQLGTVKNYKAAGINFRLSYIILGR